jgi:hypothetical protein
VKREGAGEPLCGVAAEVWRHTGAHSIVAAHMSVHRIVASASFKFTAHARAIARDRIHAIAHKYVVCVYVCPRAYRIVGVRMSA